MRRQERPRILVDRQASTIARALTVKMSQSAPITYNRAILNNQSISPFKRITA